MFYIAEASVSHPISRLRKVNRENHLLQNRHIDTPREGKIANLQLIAHTHSFIPNRMA